MDEALTLDINFELSTPKYKQIINSIIGKIEIGSIKHGQKLPSINRLSFDYILARDTVEKAYNELKRQGIIESVKGKGFYVTNANPNSRLKILLLFNKLSSYKKVIYNTLAHELSDRAHLDLFIYHCNYDVFEKILRERLTGYNYYIIMPHFIQFERSRFRSLLQEIPQDKIVLLDHQIEGIDHYHGLVYQDFKMDIYDALLTGLDRIKRYKKLILIFPKNPDYPYPKEIVLGFKRFCIFQDVDFEVVSEIGVDTTLTERTAYVVVEESDLVNLIKQCKVSNLVLGKDIGIISYNDTPLKEVLAEGISVITTDFEKMGKLAADLVLQNRAEQIKNEFKLILRNSL